jgi:hypothetical protein
MRTMRRRIRSVAAVLAVGVVAIAVIAEVSLQVAAALSSDRSGSASDGTASFRILALGDSHTYGAGVENEESYPSQLQLFLDKHSRFAHDWLSRSTHTTRIWSYSGQASTIRGMLPRFMVTRSLGASELTATLVDCVSIKCGECGAMIVNSRESFPF